jgi:hypothetical protein
VADRLARTQEKELWLRKQKEISSLLHAVLDTPGGIKVIEWLSELCMEHETTFVPGQPDVSAYNEGRRFPILRLRQALAARYEP